MHRSVVAPAVFPTAALGLAVLAIATGCASSAATRPGAPTAGRTQARTVDLATEFLATACRAAPGAEFAKAWLAYEDRHREFFDAIYYTSEESRAERLTLAEELGPRRDEMCSQVRVFLIVAPGTIERLRARVAELLGHVPRAPIYFAVALQSIDGRMESLDQQSVLALNARHETFTRASGLAVTVAHELIHDAQIAAARGSDRRLPPVARSLYREGGAVFGVQLLFPEIGIRALGLRPEQVERADVIAPQAAGELLALLRAPDPGAQHQRFFQGGHGDVLFPPKMGYYFGNKIYQRLARRQGDVAASRIAPSAFLVAAEAYLSEMSRGSVQAPPP